MVWYEIIFWTFISFILALYMSTVYALSNGAEESYSLSAPKAEPVYEFTQEELAQVREDAKAGEAWNGACENKSFWYVNDAVNASAAIQAGDGGNVFGILCHAKMKVHDLTPGAIAKAYELYSKAIAMRPDLPESIMRTRAHLGYFTDDFDRKYIPKWVEEARGKYMAAEVKLSVLRVEEVVADALKKLPSETDTRRVLDQYEQKLEYWRSHCVTFAEFSEREISKIDSTYAFIEAIAETGNADAMLCAARFFPLNHSEGQNRRAYYWYAFALLADPSLENSLAIEQQLFAQTLSPSDIKAQQDYAENTTWLMQDKEKRSENYKPLDGYD